MSAVGVLVVFALMGIVFHELFVRLSVMGDIRGVLGVAPAAVRTIRSDTLSDLEKERAVRRMSLEVLKDTLRFTVKFALVLLACLAVAALAQALFALSESGLYGLLTSWWALAALLVVMPFYARFRARHAAPPPAPAGRSGVGGPGVGGPGAGP